MNLTPSKPLQSDYFTPGCDEDYHAFNKADRDYHEALYQWESTYSTRVKFAARRMAERHNSIAWAWAAGGCAGCVESDAWLHVRRHNIFNKCPACEARLAHYVKWLDFTVNDIPF